MRDQRIFTDNGVERGHRTRFFRNAPDGSGVEWIRAACYGAGDRRWLNYMATGGWETIASLNLTGMNLQPLDEKTLAVLEMDQ